jgi:formyltetrahydrofolate hydrolase
MSKRARVLIDCKDAKGLVYLTSKVFYDRGLNIDNNREFVDKETDRFFMRTVVSGDFSSAPIYLQNLKKKKLYSQCVLSTDWQNIALQVSVNIL